MELPHPGDWSLDEATKGMMSDLDESAHQVNDLRPLRPEVLRQVKEKLLGERVFSSNAIEGNTLTLRETSLILQSGTILAGRRKREAQEAVNLGAAYRRIEQILADEGAAADESKFLEIHKILMHSVNDRIAGNYHNSDVMIRGAKHQPPGSHLVSKLMDDFFGLLARMIQEPTERNVHPIIVATWAHWAITRIHPFEDGNGRMGRLWQDLLLLHGKLTAAIIRPEDRSAYYDALGSADDGDCNPLAQLVCRRVLGTLQVYLSAHQEEADELNSWAAGLVGEVSEASSERRRLQYERWRHKAEQVRDAFELCATLVTKSGNQSIEIQVRRFDMIDQAVWESLRAGGSARRTWFFRAWFRHEQTIIWYIFYFGRHQWTEADDAIKLPGPFVGLHVSEQRPGEERAVHLDDLESTPIALRELVIVDNRLARRRWDFTSGNLVYDDDVTPIRVAKEFIEEVISKKLLR